MHQLHATSNHRFTTIAALGVTAICVLGPGCDEPLVGEICLCALPGPSTCGVALDNAGGNSTSLDEATAEFAAMCAGGPASVYRGQCADGKELLHVDRPLGSATRYFVDGKLVGATEATDVYTPGLCPFERFWGSLESVRCDAPVLEPVCPGAVAGVDAGAISIPFAQGEPLRLGQPVLGGNTCCEITGWQLADPNAPECSEGDSACFGADVVRCQGGKWLIAETCASADACLVGESGARGEPDAGR